MNKFELFKYVLNKCWEFPEYNNTHWMNFDGEVIFMEKHISEDGEDLIWCWIDDDCDQFIRGDSVYADGMDDEFLMGVLEYITTGKEY